LAQPDLRSAMGNSPSVGLGVCETHSLRDVRVRDPEKEVERSRASRAPTHNEYVELPASSEPHNTLNVNEPEICIKLQNNLVRYQPNRK